MKERIRKFKKYFNLIYSYISTYFSKTPAFVRVIPTDACNLDCLYCWQRKNVSYLMTLDEYLQILIKVKHLNVGLISYLGGEPMTWPYLAEAISETTKRNILTDLTTNGTLLNSTSIEMLGQAGLDFLNISVDLEDTSSISKKNSIFKKDILIDLQQAKKKYGMHFRFNSVIIKNRFEETKKIIEFAKMHDVQLSIGYIVPPLQRQENYDKNIYFSKDDSEELHYIISYILAKKKDGYPIIDPDSYFENIFLFLNQKKFWECNYPSRYGWINVTPKGKIRTCTKKMDELDLQFVDINSQNYKELRKIFQDKVKECNVKCYSNCAFDSYYYTHNKMQMLRKILKRINWTPQ